MIIPVNGIHYAVSTEGSGPPLALLHGFTGSQATWQPHVPIFAERFQVITIDLPGHGQTGAPANPAAYRMERVAGDLAAIWRELGVGPVHLLGYSMGGRLALYLALCKPAWVRSLILESASPGLETAVARRERASQDEQLANRIEREGIEAFVNYWERLPLFASQQKLTPATRQALRRQRLQNQPHGLANSLRGMGTGVQPSLWPSLGEMSRPSLLLAGELDSKFVAINQRMAALLPGAQLSIIPGAGHAIHLERPHHFQRAVLAFRCDALL